MVEDVQGYPLDMASAEAGAGLHPVARIVLQAVSFPIAVLAAAATLLLTGFILALGALALIGALAAGAASVPLAFLAGRRRSRRRPGVLDVEATVRNVEGPGR